MTNTAYYGEIAAKLSAHLHKNPDHVTRISQIMDKQKYGSDDTILTVCAEAARVFDQIEDLSSEHLIDWHLASDNYANQLLDHLLAGSKPHIVDMISMVARSIEQARDSHFQVSRK
ncbi:hypothetical protein BFP97_06395 [Roseivirga sp. 4D4]|uniref:hypothetical protein n=1 Tax=Roseivirga sp. 4D4 TaxID=1889784 RepID=UPI00085342C2|nr:hypothetical protein [Roseivirga sp. 4D4]OEK01161.1 hypothetical protein BFP97_06395 [Roseivirga sp. 4D4]